jgi:hypothetical protein
MAMYLNQQGYDLGGYDEPAPLQSAPPPPAAPKPINAPT